MGSPGEQYRVSVIHSRPSVICPPQTESPCFTYHSLTSHKEDLERRHSDLDRRPSVPIGYDEYEEPSHQYTPYPTHNGHYHNSTSSNCSDNSAASFQDWPDITGPHNLDPHPSHNAPEVTSMRFLPESPSPPLPSIDRRFSYHQAPFEVPRTQNVAKRERPKKSKAPSSNENVFHEPVAEKKIKLEGNVELKEKVGNKPISNCRVCGDLAVAHMHYGGVCCYSCKAFFRRATQTGKDKKYKCKSDKQCTITYTNRRSCQFCRFYKCLEIGMKPNWVLSDEQCNIRFRNVRKEGGAKEKPQGSGQTKESLESSVVVKEEALDLDKGLLMPFTGEENKSLEFLVDCYNLSKETYSFSEENDRLWCKLFGQGDTSPPPLTPGSGSGKYNYSTFDLGNLIMTVIKKNIFFVKMNTKFDEMTPHDQKLVLQKNMSEMCHIRGAIRFDCKSKNFVWYFSKKDQLQMSFERHSHPSTPGGAHGVKDTKLSNALIGHKDLSKFYTSKTSQSIFVLVSKLSGMGLPMEVFLLMIYIVLFSSDDLFLERPVETQHAQTYYMFFLHRYLNELFGRDDARMKLSRIMGILVDLRELCERSKEEELARIKMQPNDSHRY